MDKKIIEKIIIESIKKHNILTKCPRPSYIGKPTDKDLAFLKQFFGEENTNDDESDFNIDTFSEGGTVDYYNDARIQEEYEDEHGFSMRQFTVVSNWGDEGYTEINGYIYNTKEFRDYVEDEIIDVEDVRRDIDTLQEAIDESPNLTVNRIMYRGGHWVKSIRAGDVVTQKGFASLSYDETEAEAFMEDTDNRFLIEFYVPKSTKGLWLAEPFDNLKEQEYLIGQGTRYYVLETDNENRTAKVVILPT